MSLPTGSRTSRPEAEVRGPRPPSQGHPLLTAAASVRHARGMQQMLAAVDLELVAPLVAMASLVFGAVTTELIRRYR